MRRLQFPVRRLHPARLDRDEMVLAFIIRLDTAEAFEAGIGALMRAGMGETAFRIGLPDLHHCIGKADIVAIEHATFDPDLLAFEAGNDEVVREYRMQLVFCRRQAIGIIRPDGLRRRDPHHVIAPSAWRSCRAERYPIRRQAPIRERCSPARSATPCVCGRSVRPTCTSGRNRTADRPGNTSASPDATGRTGRITKSECGRGATHSD